MKKIGSGKVREIYEVSDKELVIYTTDRVSAFDVILPTPVPEKGRVLNQLSLFWFDLTKDIVKNHLVSADPKDMPEEFSKEEYKDRVMLVKKLKMLPYEFIIRGYMFGSMWKAYQAGEPFCGQVITGDYQLAQKLEKPILTPSTKATEGHDEYSVTHEGLVKDLGEELADVAIYLLGLAEILDVDLGQEVRRKMDINRRRRYGVVDGVWQRLEDGSPGENA